MSTYNGNALYGKKWAVCGDSFTAGVTGPSTTALRTRKPTAITGISPKTSTISLYIWVSTIPIMNTDIAEEVKQAVKIKQAADYPTNTHPNDRAHEFESWFIEDFLRRI